MSLFLKSFWMQNWKIYSTSRWANNVILLDGQSCFAFIHLHVQYNKWNIELPT